MTIEVYKVKVPGKGVVLSTADKKAAEKRQSYYSNAKLITIPSGER